MPPTNSATSSPRVKYRSSCDRCQDNKVKCGQEKPECERCVKKRLVCVYSPIRTMGRPRKNQTSASGTSAVGSNATLTAPAPAPVLEVPSAENDPLAVAAAAAITTPPEERLSPPDAMQGIEEDHRHLISPLPHLLDDSIFALNTHADSNSNIDPDLQSIINLDTPPDSSTSGLNYPTSSSSSHSPGTVPISGGSSTNGDASSTTAASSITSPSTAPASLSHSLQPAPVPTSCYTSILTRSLKLEQILLSAAGNPIGLEAVLEAESDFRALKTRLFDCPGGGQHSPPDGQPPRPKQITAISGTSFILTTTSTGTNSSTTGRPPCLNSITESRLCLTSLLMYAERVAEVLKDAIADFQPFPGVDSCSVRCSFFGVQNYRVLRVMDFHALRVDEFFLDRGSERVNRLWDLDGVREQLRLAAGGGGTSQGKEKGEVEVVSLSERRGQGEEHGGWEGADEQEKGNGYAGNRNFGSMTPAEGRALRRIFRLRMQKFRGALVDIHRFVKPPLATPQGGEKQERDHDREMIAQAMKMVEPMLDTLIRRVEVMEQVMAGTLG